MDESHGLGERGVGLQDLSQPRLENNDVAIVPDALREGGFVHEPGGQDVGKLQDVGGDGSLGKLFAPGGDGVLQVAANPPTNLCRESGEERLL